MFCFSCANHARTNLKGFELKNSTSLLYLPISSSVETWKIFRNMLCQLFFAWADILSEKNPYFGKHLFCKTKTDYAYKLRVQDFATGKNFSFYQCSKQERFAFFSGKLFYKSNRKLFSCVCISWYKNSRGWENSRKLCKTDSNSPNPSRLYTRLCNHWKRFLLLKNKIYPREGARGDEVSDRETTFSQLAKRSPGVVVGG